jgi:hypothetical protein
MSFLPQIRFKQQSLPVPVARLTDCKGHLLNLVKLTLLHRELVVHAAPVVHSVVLAPATTSIRRVAIPVQGILARVNAMHRQLVVVVAHVDQVLLVVVTCLSLVLPRRSTLAYMFAWSTRCLGASSSTDVVRMSWT